ETVGRVVIRRDRLRIAVDHDRLEADLLERERGVHAAIVELDALPDAVRPAAENDDLVAIRRIRLAVLFVCRVEIRGCRRELRRAAVHSLEYRPDAVLVARLAHDRLADAEQRPDAAVAEALALQRAQPLGLQRVEAFRGDGLLRLDEILDLREEPRIDLRELMDLVERHAETERVRDVPEPVGARHAELALELGPFLLGLRRAHHRRESVDADLEA